jgi:hypothetical protein
MTGSPIVLFELPFLDNRRGLPCVEAPFGLSPLEFRCGDRQVLHGPRRTPAGAGVKARRDIHAQQHVVVPEHSTALQLRGVCAFCPKRWDAMPCAAAVYICMRAETCNCNILRHQETSPPYVVR